MHLKKIKLIAALAAGLATATASTATLAADLSVATYISAKSSFVSKTLVPWADWVNEQAKGEFTLKVFAGGTLGRDPSQQAKIVADGIADMALVVPSRSPGLYPDFAVFGLPGFATSTEEGTQAAMKLFKDGKLGTPDNTKTISIWTSDPYMVHSTSAVSKLDDLKNLKIRVAGSTQTQTLLTLGANPQAVKSSEMAESISRGVIDGALSDWAVAAVFKLPEVTDSIYNIPLGVLPFTIAMNNDTYNKLSDQGKAVIVAAGEEWARRGSAHNAATRERMRAALEEKEDHSVVNASAEEISTLFDLTAGLREKVSEKVADGLLEAYSAELKALR